MNSRGFGRQPRAWNANDHLDLGFDFKDFLVFDELSFKRVTTFADVF